MLNALDNLVKEWTNTRLINSFRWTVVRRDSGHGDWSEHDEALYEAIKRELYRRLEKDTD